MTIYGYARISTKKQSLQRQINNIEAYNENAIIYEEEFTGRKVEGRKEFQKLLKKVKANDTIIFDSVSRMSRNAEEGIKLYMDLFDRGVNLIFLNEMHINTDTYRKQIEQANIPTTDNTIVNMILEGVVNALKELAKEQIKIAFEQSQKEVDDLSIRTSKGIEAKRKEAKKNNKEFKIGREAGAKVTTKKSIEAKKEIQRLSKDFNGSNKDKEVIEILKINRNTYYKYKKELVQELQQKEYEQQYQG